MTTWIALLRGINLAGRNRVPMPELRSMAEQLGLDLVATYVQSGNMVFSSELDSNTLTRKLRGAIADKFDLSVPVVLRDAGALDEVAASHPFEDEEDDPRFLNVVFLEDEPAVDLEKGLPATEFQPDRVALAGLELYIHYRNGSGRSKLTLATIEKRLSVRGTARNWRTVQKLADMTRPET